MYYKEKKFNILVVFMVFIWIFLLKLSRDQNPESKKDPKYLKSLKIFSVKTLIFNETPSLNFEVYYLFV